METRKGLRGRHVFADAERAHTRGLATARILGQEEVKRCPRARVSGTASGLVRESLKEEARARETLDVLHELRAVCRGDVAESEGGRLLH